MYTNTHTLSHKKNAHRFFCGRTSTHTTVKALGKEETYEILNVNKFNSARKRMSVVCRTPEGKLVLYVKGADNIMVERLAKNQAQILKNIYAYILTSLQSIYAYISISLQRTRHKFSKAITIVVMYSEYARALTFSKILPARA